MRRVWGHLLVGETVETKVEAVVKAIGAREIVGVSNTDKVEATEETIVDAVVDVIGARVIDALPAPTWWRPLWRPQLTPS